MLHIPPNLINELGDQINNMSIGTDININNFTPTLQVYFNKYPQLSLFTSDGNLKKDKVTEFKTLLKIKPILEITFKNKDFFTVIKNDDKEGQDNPNNVFKSYKIDEYNDNNFIKLGNVFQPQILSIPDCISNIYSKDEFQNCLNSNIDEMLLKVGFKDMY